MGFSLERIPYNQTGFFSRLVLDFLSGKENLRPFYTYSAHAPNFDQAIAARGATKTNRKTLVEGLQQQYAEFPLADPVRTNLSLLEQSTTFTVCTAHQPNIFTGYLYFIYKIIQTIKLAQSLQSQFSNLHFIPVFYMGSEDNDLQELNHIRIGDQTIQWTTAQTGAVGRMKTEGFMELIEEVQNAIGRNEHAQSIAQVLKKAYLEKEDIQQATLYLVNHLFGKYGLVVVIADRPAFKRLMAPVILEELLEQSSFRVVGETNRRLSQNYPVQATPREINLFYLHDGCRERIVREKEVWKVLNTGYNFNRISLKKEVELHPERFSPNVILRGILQETILPNIAFIGGGGEIAYWMQLKDLFAHYQIPYPVLVLRNSLLWVGEKQTRKLDQLGLLPQELFRDTETLINHYVQKHSQDDLDLKEEKTQILQILSSLTLKAKKVDPTLEASVLSEIKKVTRSLDKLSLKCLRAEKKKFLVQTNQIRKIRMQLFPDAELQERVDNFLPYYAQYGETFLDRVYEAIEPISEEFTLVLNS
ncbi:MAG: bacillithiol biosynthesis cysteine-adding enzyme BshC [Chitinophagaceae bacterium]